MIINIVGYYDSNFGDLLMLQGIINNLPSRFNKVNILSYGNLDVNKLSISHNAEICTHNIKMSLVKLAMLHKEADVLMWGGGSCFNDVDGTGGVKQFLFAKIVNPKIKIVYYGVGIDIKHNIKNYVLLKTVLLICSKFAVRDVKSYEIVKNYNCSELIDDPIYLNKRWLDNVKSKRSPHKLFLSYRCVNDYYPKTYSIYIDSFVSNIMNLLKKINYKNVCIISGDEKVDNNDNKFIYKAITNTFTDVEVVFKNTSLVDTCREIKSSSLVITGRLHIAVIASYYNVPFFLLNYSEKNKQFVAKERRGHLVEYESMQDKEYLSKCVISNMYYNDNSNE